MQLGRERVGRAIGDLSPSVARSAALAVLVAIGLVATLAGPAAAAVGRVEAESAPEVDASAWETANSASASGGQYASCLAQDCGFTGADVATVEVLDVPAGSDVVVAGRRGAIRNVGSATLKLGATVVATSGWCVAVTADPETYDEALATFADVAGGDYHVVLSGAPPAGCSTSAARAMVDYVEWESAAESPSPTPTPTASESAAPEVVTVGEVSGGPALAVGFILFFGALIAGMLVVGAFRSGADG